MEPSYSPPCPVCPSWYGNRAERKHRKKAAANIFQDVELGQVRALFRRSGDQEADERARIVWDETRREEGQSLGQALMDLRASRENSEKRERKERKKNKKNKTRSFFQQNKNAAAEFLGLMWIKAFNKMRIGDCGGEDNRSSLWQRSKMKRKRLNAKRTLYAKSGIL